MPAFEYTARDSAGNAKSGLIQADSEAAVIRSLSQDELFPVRIQAHVPRGQRSTGLWALSGRIKLRELGTTYNQLADLLGAGVPLLKGLDILSKVVVNARLRRVLSEVCEDVSAGSTFSDALGKHPGTFTPLHVAMIKAGEHAGFLEAVLNNLAAFLERQDDLRSKVRGAMIYPVILAVFGVCVVTGILIFLVPKFQQFLRQPTLPVPTRVLFAASDALHEHLVMVAAAVVLVVFSVRAYIRSSSGRRRWDQWKLKIPAAGRAIRMVAITRFCRVLGTMLANGVPIIQALEISKDATGNKLLTEAIAEAAENVRAGQPLAEPLKRSGMFPAEIIEMIAIGEESNQLEKVLVQVADAVERRTNRQVDAAVRLVEPLMLMFMAGVIGFIALGLLYPIFTMAQTMSRR